MNPIRATVYPPQTQTSLDLGGMSVDIETAFAAIRWEHIRTVEAMHALTERNVELEREVFNHATTSKAEKLKRKKAYDELKAGVREMFRQLKGELAVSRTLVYTQSAMCHNDNIKLVNRLGRRAEELARSQEVSTFELGSARSTIERLQDRLLMYEDELAGNLKEQLASMRAELQNERARSVAYEHKYTDIKKRLEDKLSHAEQRYKSLDAQFQSQTRKYHYIEAEHIAKVNALSEDHELELTQKDGEIVMLKQFLADRDKKIEHLIAELEKAKAQSMGGSSFKKYVQLKSQNVELQNELEHLSKQVDVKSTGRRGGRRAAKNVTGSGIVPQMVRGSLATDSITSDFADEKTGGSSLYKKDLNQRLPPGPFTSQSASSKRRNAAGVDPSLLSPTSSASVMAPIDPSIQSANKSGIAGGGSVECAPEEEEDDSFGADGVIGGAHRAPRRKRQPTGFASGLPCHSDEETGKTSLLNSSSFGGREKSNIIALTLDQSGSLSEKAAAGMGRGGSHSEATVGTVAPPVGNNTLKLSPRSPRNRSNSPGKSTDSQFSPSSAILRHSPVVSYDPAESLFAQGSPRRGGATELGIVGSDVPRIRGSNGDDSRAAASPRRHLGEFENKKASRLTFI